MLIFIYVFKLIGMFIESYKKISFKILHVRDCGHVCLFILTESRSKSVRCCKALSETSKSRHERCFPTGNVPPSCMSGRGCRDLSDKEQ